MINDPHITRRHVILGAAAMTVIGGEASAYRRIGTAARAADDSLAVKVIEVPRRKLNDLFRRLTEDNFFSGAILLAKDDKIIFQEAYGLASREYQRRANVNTRFKLGSMNKMFTATAIMKLVEQGKLGLDSPIDRFLGPDWLPTAIAHAVTIAHLLAHTSGLDDYFPRLEPLSRDMFATLGDYKRLIVQSKLVFEPGSQWLYSNSGYILLGEIVERITRRPYLDVYDEMLFRPARMAVTGSLDITAVDQGYAQGYGKEPLVPPPPPAPGSTDPPGMVDFAIRAERVYEAQRALHAAGYRLRNNVLAHTRVGVPAGGMYSTVGDMHRFLYALNAGTLVEPATLRLMRSPKPSAPRWGYGLEPIGRGFGHTGGFMGVDCVACSDSDGGYVIILSNIDGGSKIAYSELRRLTA